MIVYDGVLRVDYRQFYVWSDQEGCGSENFTGGQQNGLCGAKVDGSLFLTTATHYGAVGLRVETLPAAVTPDSDAEDIVEVSFRPNTTDIMVVPWGDAAVARFELPLGWYRVRYSLFNVQAAIGADGAEERDYDQVIDRYLLQLWPEDSERPDEIVRVSGPWAQYWHDAAQGIEQEPPRLTPETSEGDWAEAFVAAPQQVKSRVARWLTDEVASRVRQDDPELAQLLAESLPGDEASLERLWWAREHRAAAFREGREKEGSAAWRCLLYLGLVHIVQDRASRGSGDAFFVNNGATMAAEAFGEDWPAVLSRLNELTTLH